MGTIIKTIAAVDKNWIIGNKSINGLLWKEPDDLKNFRYLTTSHIVVMGYNTFKSLKFKPLKDRTNIVLYDGSNIPDELKYRTDIDCYSTDKFDINKFADKFINKDKIIWIIGGKSIYERYMNYSDAIHITHLHKSYGLNDDKDLKFPYIDNSIYKLSYISNHKSFNYEIYTKIGN